MQEDSPCISTGRYGLDMGAVFYNDIPELAPYFEIMDLTDDRRVKIRWLNPSKTVHGNFLDTLNQIFIWRNEELIYQEAAVFSLDTFELIDELDRPDYFTYSIAMLDTADQYGRINQSPNRLLGGQIEGIIIWEMDKSPRTGAVLQETIPLTGYDHFIYRSDNPGKYPLNESIDAVFVCLGIYSNNHILTDQEGLALKNYLDSGGNIYMEGGDTWNFDSPTPVHSYFHINGIADGNGDLTIVRGSENTLFSGMEFIYNGSNSYIDHLAPSTGAEQILYNPNPGYGVGITYMGNSYNTIGTSFQLGGLQDSSQPSTKQDLVKGIMEFFGLNPNSLESQTDPIPDQFDLHQNFPNPFNPSTTISYQLITSAPVKIIIYNTLGQEIIKLVNQVQIAGYYNVTWDGKNYSGIQVPSGIYYCQFMTGKFKKSLKMILMK